MKTYEQCCQEVAIKHFEENGHTYSQFDVYKEAAMMFAEQAFKSGWLHKYTIDDSGFYTVIAFKYNTFQDYLKELEK